MSTEGTWKEEGSGSEGMPGILSFSSLCSYIIWSLESKKKNMDLFEDWIFEW